MASGSGIFGNEMSRSYAVWDNGWRPLKPETHLESDGWDHWALERIALLWTGKILVTQCRRRCINEGPVSMGVALSHDLLRVSLCCSWLLCCKANVLFAIISKCHFYCNFVMQKPCRGMLMQLRIRRRSRGRTCLTNIDIEVVYAPNIENHAAEMKL